MSELTDRPTPHESIAAHEYLAHAEQVAARVPGLNAGGTRWRPSAAGVIGAGMMGGGIAMGLADIGIPTVLVERSSDALTSGLGRIRSNYESSVRRGRLSPESSDERLALITGTTDFASLANAELVIEAVFEDMGLKQQVFGQLDRAAPAGAILATNTSGLDIDQIASATNRPENVIGAHFFSPANVMRLLEIVPGHATTPEVIEQLMEISQAMGKVGVIAGNAPGFIGNAIMESYFREALLIVEDGALPAQVDSALVSFGMQMGFFTVMDMAGHEVGIENRRNAITTRPNDRRYSDLDLHVVDLGRVGQRVGAGWYRYEPGDRTPHLDSEMDQAIVDYSASIGITRREITDQEILERYLFSMVNRAAALLSEGVAQRPSDIDLVYVNGYGFPADRGGPLYWADSIGLPRVLEAVERFHAIQSPWWKPAPLLKELVRSGSTFGILNERARDS